MEIARTGHHADSRAVARDTRGWKPRAQDTSRSARRQCKCKCTKRLKQETTRSARRSHQMVLCAIKATPASALPTATCGYVGGPKFGGTEAVH